MIKKVELYVNTTKDIAFKTASQLEKRLINYGYTITNKNPDLVIGFGGDGTLLNWLIENSYNVKSRYIGINCGSLGFMQDFNVDNISSIDTFIQNIPTYIEEKLNFIKITIITNTNAISYHALNEISIWSKNHKRVETGIYIAGEHLENFAGSGLLFSTPTGSTAQNLSQGGSILFPSFEGIEFTPCGISANNLVRNLRNSICIPKGLDITLEPLNGEEMTIIADNKEVFSGLYDKIIISISDKYMIKLEDKSYSFVAKIRDKLI